MNDTARATALEARLRDLESQLAEAARTAGLWEAAAAQHRSLIENLPDVVWTADDHGRAVYISGRVAEVFGFTPAEVYERGEELWLNRIHPDDVGHVWAAYQGLFHHRHLFDVVYRYQHRDGHWAWIKDRALNIYEKDGVRYTDGTLADISALMRSEEALGRQKELLQTVFDEAPVMLMLMSEAGRPILMNRECQRVLGWTGDEVDDLDFLAELLPDPADLARARACVAAGARTPEEFRMRTRDGRDVDALWASARLSDGTPICIGQDITSRRQLEEHYRQAQKMEAVGLLAGGIAHDFNNLLTTILGYSEVLLTDMPAGDPRRDPIAQIQKAGDRAAALTKQLLAFGRKQVLQPRVLDLGALVVEAGTMFRRVIGENIELVTTVGTARLCVRADSGQVEQVMMNLVINARDALAAGGRLSIETSRLSDDTPASRAPELAPGPYVVLTVTDTGTGIGADVLPRIFEPFFTTKGRGKGTGLGLAMTYGIVKQSGGHMTVTSTPGRGATFTLYLPEVDEAPADLPVIVPPLLPGGNETILLVEDEPSVRLLTEDLLRGRGYTVLSSGDPVESVTQAAAHDGPIDLVLTDIIMPGMNGRELADRLHQDRPDMPVVFMSGYTDEVIAQHGVLHAGTHFVQKPFTPDALLRKLREVLDATILARDVDH